MSLAVFALSLLTERFAHAHKSLRSARAAATVGVFSAIAAVLMLLEIPLFFAPGFYKLDLSEIPVLICAFSLGPAAGVLTEFFKILLFLLLKGTSTAFVGDFANFLVGCTFVFPASAVYLLKKTKKGAVLGLVTGTLCMTLVGSLLNAVYLIPKFAELFRMPVESIIAMGTAVNPAIDSLPKLVLLAVVPFNILKGAVDSLLTFALYKRVQKLLHR